MSASVSLTPAEVKSETKKDRRDCETGRVGQTSVSGLVLFYWDFCSPAGRRPRCIAAWLAHRSDYFSDVIDARFLSLSRV